MTTVNIYHGDAWELAEDLALSAPQSINTIVTSPPYWGLRDYGEPGQFGLEATPEEYVTKLVDLFALLRPALRDDGTIFLNLGDSYFTKSASGRLPTSGSSRQADRNSDATPDPVPTRSLGDAPIPASLESTPTESSPLRPADSRPSDTPSVCLLCGTTLAPGARESAHTPGCTCGTEQTSGPLGHRTSGMDSSDLAYPHCTTQSLKPKDLIGIPWRVAFALQADGWYLRQDIIWHKPNPMPESVTDRCTKSHEYIFLLSKSPHYYFDHEDIKEPAVSGYKSSDFIPKSDKDKALLDSSIQTCATGASSNNRTDEHVSTRNKRDVWTVPTAPFAAAHFATFPPALITPCVLAGCPEGGTVLDPFGGSGTTAMVARDNGRNAILFELNAEYIEIARTQRLGETA
jgi:DNA modification methylase